MRLDTIEGAILFAAQAHDGQVDHAGMPYILHPLRVGSRLHDMGDHYVIAGLLHDVIEDTPHTLLDLRALGAHPDVLDAVAAVTRTDRWATYESALDKAAAHPIGGWVKASDVADNYTRLDHITDPDKKARLTAKYEKAIPYLADRGYNPKEFL